jgi:L-threonylcarbamoyladenylate synthase
MGDTGDEAAVASRLFAVLRQMDEDQIDCIFSESFRGAGVAEAVMNRLMKAAGHNLIRVGS